MRIDTAHSRGTKIIGATVVVALILALFSSGIPQTAVSALLERQTFTNSEVDIVAQVNTDSSLDVADQRTIQFTDKTTCIKWMCNSAGSNTTIGVRGVRVSYLDSDGSSIRSQEFTLETFDEAWASTNCRDSKGPGAGKFAVDHSTNTVYLFVDESQSKAIFSLEYSISLVAVPWRDVGEVDWTFFSSDWPVQADNVHVSLHVPAPANVEVVAGDNVNAWSHAPAGSLVEINPAGFVTYKADRISQGQSANLHVTFPSSWLTSMPRATATTQHANDMRLDTVKANELKWADTWTAGWVRGNIVDIILLAICALMLLASLVIYLAFGRDYKPKFTEPLLRRKPDCILHPAIVGRLWRWNRESNDELVATILHLIRKGVIAIEYETDTFCLKLIDKDKRLNDKADLDDKRLNDLDGTPIDAETVALLFETLSGGESSVALKEIETFANEHPEEFKAALKTWHSNLTQETDKYEFFEKRGFKLQTRMLVAALLLLIVAIAAKLVVGTNTLLLAAIPTAILMSFLANYLPRRTQKGQDLVAECKALATWMEQLPQSGESLGATREECDEMMVYAQIFGTVESASSGNALKATGKTAYDCPCCAWHKALCETFKD